MNSILFVAGTRPELIKILPIVERLKKENKTNCILYFTNQHQEMAECVFRDYHEKADVVGIAKAEYDLSRRTLAIQNECLSVIKNTNPVAVCVQGDTASAYAGALSGFLFGLPVCHIEAGLRTYRHRAPFPEEAFRRAADAMSDFYFCTNEEARKNLIREGEDPNRIFTVGNTAEDSLRKFFLFPLPFPKGRKRRVLLTLHRRETEEEYFFRLLTALSKGARYGEYEVLFPVHGSPRMKKIGSHVRQTPGFHILPYLSPAAFYPTLKSADLIITDSGGVCEECACLGIPTLVFRRETERMYELRQGRISLFNMSADMRTEIRRGFSLAKREARFRSPSPSAEVAKILKRKFLCR